MVQSTEKSYYEVLGVSEKATTDEIKKSFKKLARKHHPDAGGDEAIFKEQFARCQTALDALAGALDAAKPDFTVIVSDDQDEWFFEDNMPVFAVYWDSMVPLRPREAPPDAPEYMRHLLGATATCPWRSRSPRPSAGIWSSI